MDHLDPIPQTLNGIGIFTNICKMDLPNAAKLIYIDPMGMENASGKESDKLFNKKRCT